MHPQLIPASSEKPSHEPILERDIGADLAAIGRLIHARCPHTLGWLQRHERATTVLAALPLAQRP